MNFLIEALKIPKKAYIGDKLTKKMFIQHPDISSADKKLIQETVDTIQLQYVLNEQTMNISPYSDETRSYKEILVFEIPLKAIKNHKRLSQLIHMLIPNPVILILMCEIESIMTLAQKRKSMSDYSKITLEEFLYTEWFHQEKLTERQSAFIDNLDVKNLSYANLYRFYSDITDNILRYNLSKYTGTYTQDMFKSFNSHELKEKMATLEKIDSSLEDLKKEIDKETNFNNKMAINVEMVKLRQKRKRIVEDLN